MNIQKIPVIDLDYRETECYVCGQPASGKLGVPTYEDLVVHNGWLGEWVGVYACSECFDLQNKLTIPICIDELKEQSMIPGQPRVRILKHDSRYVGELGVIKRSLCNGLFEIVIMVEGSPTISLLPEEVEPC